MQINQAKFEDNGQSGFLLKPNSMINENLIKTCFEVYVEIISGRNLPRRIKKSDIASEPFVQVELITQNVIESCKKTKFETQKSNGNGLFPLWSGPRNASKLVTNDLESSFIRFSVMESDVLGKNFLTAQATHSLSLIRQGCRSVQLKNEFSETLEISSLLVNIEISKARNC